ncbi:TIGR01212 family radical SAM protein [Anaerorhabdus sp.]|uniref:TIGR01212 family radical SAM protein n=1 Tax=Anaerorhabdus sp. TaxID=1872524 RepID=UPI002B21AC76|nr:TIGR01212 family radical SAM protein [Anaerorhabdus sp.]MEA4873838.1 TIGR01212 family radical SAM protein [Anaerorhabdus sp.]
MNLFKFSDDNKRYHTWNYYLRHRFNSKVYKVPLNAGFTCPNRDGTCGIGGCTFCNAVGSGNFTQPSSMDLLSQYYEGKKMMENKWPNSKTIAYFQSYTNTYGTLKRVKECLEPFMSLDEVVGIALGTRADCLPQTILDYLHSCSTKKEIWIELGLQSIFDTTAQRINRGHTFDVFKDAVKRIKKTNCKICVHVINGLPNENKEMMIDTIKALNELNIDAVKIHMLHITTHTKLEEEFNKEPFHILTLDEYVDIVCDQLQYLDPKIIIQRLTGDAIKEELVTPLWTLNKTVVLNEIDKKMARYNLYQGLKICKKI